MLTNAKPMDKLLVQSHNMDPHVDSNPQCNMKVGFYVLSP